MMRLRTGTATWLLLALAPLAATAQVPPPPAAPPSLPSPAATPAPVAPPTTLPPVSIPATGPAPTAPLADMVPPGTAPVTATPATTATGPTPTAPLADIVPPGATAPEEPETSMGHSKTSIFFSPIQIQAVTEALQDYEKNVSTTLAPKTDLSVDLTQLQAEEVPKIVEPTTYPVFYLSSIAYRSAGDWSIWVSGHKITSHKNTTNLQIVSVTPNQASFAWKPSYADSINTRKSMNMLAPVEPVKNRLTSAPSFNHDPATGIITFTLRPNQSFAAAYLNTFEGFIESPSLPPMTAENTAAAAPVPSGAKPATAPNGLQSTDMRQSPSEVVGTLSVSASRREIDAQLERAKQNKAAAATAP